MFQGYFYGLNSSSPVVSIVVDITKAYDNVDGSIILHKLVDFGTWGLPLKWFNSYLSGRMQGVT